VDRQGAVLRAEKEFRDRNWLGLLTGDRGRVPPARRRQSRQPEKPKLVPLRFRPVRLRGRAQRGIRNAGHGSRRSVYETRALAERDLNFGVAAGYSCVHERRLCVQGVILPVTISLSRSRQRGQSFGRQGSAGSGFCYGCDLFPRHVKLFHHFLHAQILQILDDRRNGQAGTPKHPCAGDLAWDAFNGWALGPIKRCHIRTVLSS